MKQLRPSFILAASALCCWSVAAVACDQSKAKNSSASASASCVTTASSAVAFPAQAAEHDCCAAKASATTAKKASARTRANAVVAEAGGACGMQTTKTTAMTAGAEGSCAAHGMKNTAVATGAGGSCAAHGMKGVTLSGGGSCNGKGMVSVSGHADHADCDACGDMEMCDQTLRGMGASVRVVPLKNGVMYIYTTEPAKARSVQYALAQRNERMVISATSGNDAQLCPDCRQMRGAAKSGKLSREIVNIEGGCLALVTSSDPTIVARIHSMSGVATMARAKL